jgi:trigger factor
MTEATCRREIEIEIHADEVEKNTKKIARDLSRVARIPGFRPGKAPEALIRRRFSKEIQSEVVQALAPEHLERELKEKKLLPITRPELQKVDFTDAGALKLLAVFEVLPEFALGDYKDLEVTVSDPPAGDAQLEETIKEIRERHATFTPVEDRAAVDGDSVLIKLDGMLEGGGDPVHVESAVCHLGSPETLPAFNENLKGVKPGDRREFDAVYPTEYPEPKLAGKTYHYSAEVREIRQKTLAELNDDFAAHVSGVEGVKTMDGLRAHLRQRLEAAREERKKSESIEKILALIVSRHDFPVPEAMVEDQVRVRLERMARSLAGQGIDPRAVNVDWVAIRDRQRGLAVEDVKAELIMDRIADAEGIEVTDAEVDREIGHIAESSNEAATAIRARLTKDGTLDRMKSKLRSDKTLEFLLSSVRVQSSAGPESQVSG